MKLSVNIETTKDKEIISLPKERAACEDCAMWEYIDSADEVEGVGADGEELGIGNCHRWPPVHKPENKALFEVNGCVKLRPHTTREWAQPITLSTDWCGEFSTEMNLR